MRRIFLFLSAAPLLLAHTAAAEYDFRDFRLGGWESLAGDCGEIYQSYVVYEVEHLLGDLREDMWRRARELGATEDEITGLQERFEMGRKKAMDRPFNRDISEDFHDIGVLMLEGDAAWNYGYCTDTLD